MTKYPYIPNKRMYAAVMGACQYVRKTGRLHKAVSYYADKYDVDEKELEQHIRARQAAGQKGKTSKATGKHYRWFVVAKTSWCEAQGVTAYVGFQVCKGLTAKTVVKRFADSDWRETMRGDYGGAYSADIGHVVVCDNNGYSTEQEALKAMDEFEKRDRKERWYLW